MIEPIKYFASAIMVCTFAIIAACQSPSVSETNINVDTQSDTKVTSQPLTLGTTYHLPSEVYGTDREINVYVPNIPEWGKDYFDTPLSVLYIVDGGIDQDFFHIASLSQLTLVNAERQPMIVVGVRTYDRGPEISPKPADSRYAAKPFEGFGGSHDFRDHLINEVQPFIEDKFQTGRNVIIGESLAGLFIVETFLETPTAFDDYISISPSLWWDDRRLSKQADDLLNEHTASDRRLYLSMADEGGTMRLGLDELLKTLEAHTDKVEVKFVDRANSDTHSSIYHHAARDALKWMFGIPSEPYGEAPWYLVIGGEPKD